MIISLSTCYLQEKFPNDGYAMLQEAANMGYEYVELGHSTPLSSVEGILKALEEGVVKVSSLHNFCPLPPFANGPSPNLYSPATKSKTESEQWARHTRTTIEFAHLFGAERVVAHSGALSFFFSPRDAKLKKAIEDTGRENILEDSKYKKVLNSFKKNALKLSLKQYPKILENLNFVQNLLKENEVLLCLENRDGYAELPFDCNMETLIESAPENVRSWHDVGHSKIKELAGIQTQIELAEKLAPTLAGWHLHDCDKDGHDHLGIGEGDIDFKALAKYFDPEKHVFTLELNSRVEMSSAKDSLKKVQDLF